MKSLYKSQFHPVEYMRQYYADIDPEEGFFLTELHHFFQTMAERSANDLDLAPHIVMEVGCGPLISGAKLKIFLAGHILTLWGNKFYCLPYQA